MTAFHPLQIMLNACRYKTSRLRREDIGLPHRVDGFQPVPILIMPEGPAVARRRALELRAEAMDRAGSLAAEQGAVGADRRDEAALAVEQQRTRRDQPRLYIGRRLQLKGRRRV